MGKEIESAEVIVYNNIRSILISAKQKAYSVINFTMVEAYWEIGRQIMEAQDNNPRAEYGAGLINYLAERLTGEFGKGFTTSNLKYMRQFYVTFPIRHTLCDQLSWSHYRLLMKINNTERREFYLKECAESNWSVRQLERQITTFFYERLLATQKEGKESVKNEIQKTEPRIGPGYVLKDPYILEFLDLKTGKLTYQDIGQIDFYVRYFEENIKQKDDNPTIGIVLCSEKNDAMAKYSVLADNDRLFASKYMTYLPTEEELKKELKRERVIIERSLEEIKHEQPCESVVGEQKINEGEYLNAQT
jgi:hypothetical protein